MSEGRERDERKYEDDDRDRDKERRRRDSDDRDRPPPPKKSSKMPLLIGGIIGGMLVCCGGPAILIGVIGIGAKAQKDDQTNQVEQAKPIEISADQLLREYKENEPKANDAYKGKVVQVSGPVKRVTEGWVELKGAGQFEFLTVDCHFDDRKVMASFSGGSQVTIKGVCDGKGFGGINIRRCQQVK